MLEKLKRHFVLMYTLSAGGILIFILIILGTWSKYQVMQKQKESFSLQMDRVVFELQKSNMMDAATLQMLEYENHLILYFEENGKELYYNGNYGTKEIRLSLIKQVRQEAIDEGITLNLYPSVATRTKSSIFTITSAQKKQFLGQATVLPTQGSWINIIVLQDISQNSQNRYQEYILIGMLFFVAIAGLYFFSSYFVKKTLHPVRVAQSKQNEFVAAASHELKSPLAVIKTCACAAMIDSEKREEFLSDIVEECNRMSKLIEDLLLLASAQTKNWTMKLERFALDENLIREYDRYSLQIQRKQQKLKLTLPDSMENDIYSDKNRLNQVLTILLDNASSYSPEHSEIEVKLEQEKKRLYLSVIDHGVGISKEIKEHIFEAFYRGNKARNEKSHYGLGLSIAKDLLHRMGATIDVLDTYGGGTTFVIGFEKCS